MDDTDTSNNTEGDNLLTDLTSQYSEGCQAFVLRDFDTTTGIVDDLLDRIEQDKLGLDSSSNDDDLTELVRRVWILYITLIASANEQLARDSKQAESELAAAHSRIARFYARSPSATTTAAQPSSAPSTSSTSSTSLILIHPSLLVALSLAGLKLEIPLFVRRTLQDYFRLLLLSHAAHSEDEAISASQGDISTLDVSHADLSLSGIAVNGHRVNGTNGHLASNNDENQNTSSTTTRSTAALNKRKSLHRLSRIYSVHLLGRSMGEWSNARAWIREMADDDTAVAVGFMSDSYAQTLLEALEEAKLQQEEEEREARQAEKSEKERQAELKKSKKSTSSSAQAGTSGNAVNGHVSSLLSSSSPPARPERSKERASTSSTTSPTGPKTANATSEEQETGFAAFRSHLSSFLSTSPESSSDSSSSSSLARRPGGSHLSHTSTTSFDLLRVYSSRFVHSRLLKLLLAFFIITGFWRRRLARRGSGIKLDVGKRLGMLKDKIVETVKMGGSLGFL